jgi:hypothetical protein
MGRLRKYLTIRVADGNTGVQILGLQKTRKTVNLDTAIFCRS